MPNLELLLGLLGSTSGLAALAGFIYTIGFRLGALSTKVDLLWDVYVIRALSAAASKGYGAISSWGLTAEGEKVLPQDIRGQIDSLAEAGKLKDKPIREVAFAVISHIGPERLARLAVEAGLDVEVVVGTAIIYALSARGRAAR